MGQQVPLLVYNRVDHRNDFIATRPDVFRQHLQHLAENAWRSMSLNEFEAYSQDGRILPERRFLLSFGDGYDYDRLPRHYFRHFAWPWGNSTREWRKIADHLGFSFQYTVARASFQKSGLLQEIPRVCFDTKPFEAFQRQFWLQTGALARGIWNGTFGKAYGQGAAQ